jgi:choline dehydrogenase-like flavoprotein
MTLQDALDLPSGSSLETDVCIVGAGAAGITLALELAAAGIESLLVEGGGLEPEPETQALHDIESVGDRVREDYMARARCFGGTCNLWSGRCMRLTPTDVEPRAWIGDSGWPIAYEEIARHYEAAGRAFDLPGPTYLTASHYDALMGRGERLLLEGGSLEPTISLWARRPMRFGAAHRRRLERSPRIRVLLHANALGLAAAGDGRRVERLRAGTLDGRRHEIRARTFVLGAGGLENARLLLASSDVQASGLGNGEGLVGRYFMEHPRAVFGRVRLGPDVALRLMRGRPLARGRMQLGLAPSREVQEREGLLHHYLTFEDERSTYAQKQYDTAVQVAKVVLRRGHAGGRTELRRALEARMRTAGLIYLLTPKEILPHWAYRTYATLRPLLHERRRERRYVVVFFCEQPPDPASRVYLGGERDRLGMRKLVLDWRIGGEVGRSMERLRWLLGRELQKRHLGVLDEQADGPDYTDASHHIGTTRMSNSPRTGVVDPDCRVHGIENLFVAGSSVFPTAGHANPTLTIVALAIRLARHLAARAA